MAHRFRSRMPELHKLGVNLALGVDVAKIWTFGELARIAYLVARQGGDYLSAETLLAMQTIGGAQALGLADMVGSLEASRSIDTVICDGEVLLRHGSLTRLDERAVYEMGRASARRLAARLDRAPWTRWPIVSAGTGPKTPARRSKARTTR
jgi:cytosine/adenosine deaminase-related metal-dependent hydrolase